MTLQCHFLILHSCITTLKNMGSAQCWVLNLTSTTMLWTIKVSSGSEVRISLEQYQYLHESPVWVVAVLHCHIACWGKKLQLLATALSIWMLEKAKEYKSTREDWKAKYKSDFWGRPLILKSRLSYLVSLICWEDLKNKEFKCRHCVWVQIQYSNML